MHVNKRKKDDFSSFVKCGWGGWIGTPAQNFAGPPRDVGLALCFTRACQLSAPNQVGSLTCAPYPIKKLSVKESFFIGWGGWNPSKLELITYCFDLIMFLKMGS